MAASTRASSSSKVLTLSVSGSRMRTTLASKRTSIACQAPKTSRPSAIVATIPGLRAKTSHQVLPKDYQLHPVKDTVMHVDLLRVSDRTKVTVEIPVSFLRVH